jgi:dolichol-phosphate mannosyltransferase
VANNPAGSINSMPTRPDTLSAATPSASGSLPALLREVRRGSNWAQLMRFAAVGASGYLVNLAVFALALNAKVEYRAAAAAAFGVALVNNFAWNRLWTFRDTPGRIHGQALRFVVVSATAFVVSLAILSVLVRDAGVSKLLAQAAAILAVTPMSFLANKLWSFGTSQA